MSDRLARNSVDGGRIIFFIDSEHITALKFPTFWFEATPQGKFMLSIAFGQSKYFVDNLSENTKRGLRQKLRRGEWPGWAPLGYANDILTHTVVKDKERFLLVRKLFEMYATGAYSMKDLQNTAISIGLFGKSGKVTSVSLIQHTLSNPFYYGVLRYNGEMHQGKHEPMISKRLFDKVSLPPLWADNMLAKIESEREQDAQSGVAFAQNLKQEIEDLDEQLDKLLDTHLDGLIPKVEYAEKKQKILNRKIDVSEKLKDFEQKGNHRLEPMRLFVLDSKQAGIIASGENFEDKKNFLKKIGSNPLLAKRALQFSPKKSWEILLNSWDSATPATLTRASREPNFGLHTDWLRGQGSDPGHPR